MEIGNGEEVPDEPLAGSVALCPSRSPIKDQLFFI